MQNLSLIEESFRSSGNKNHGNSEAKAHKANKNKNRKFKQGKQVCWKHPDKTHTWAECFQNPKGKNFKGKTANTNNNPKKAEARNMDVDSDADMDRQLEIVNIDKEEVQNLNL